MNKVIERFGSSLKAEKEALSLIRSDIKVENVELTSSIISKIEKLQEDLAVEYKIMDELAKKTQKAKVLSVTLKNATKHNDGLEDERTLVKACVSEINQYLMRLVETHDSLFIVSIRQQLSDKLQLVFAMLNQIQGVPGSGDSLKQGEIGNNRQSLQLIRRIM